ncbi:TPA: DUF2235 domain-containing protein [Pseudomonas aeruginosa]|nr:DUF2235 domain-containing protein [Pseudomonas aeruginosa]
MDDLSPDSALPPAGSAQDNDAPRQLVVCIDGTSNRFGDQPTNVVRLYRSLSRDPRRVLAYYDQGVGTFGLKETLFEWQKFPSRIAGLAFGWGLKRNVEGAYRFLAEHYRPGDQIFLFGFSRGAYAVRVLAAMLRAVGLIDAHQPHLFDYAWTLLTTRMPPRDEDKRAGTRRRGPDFGLLGRFRKVFGRQVKVHFLGLFDTVTSVGWVYDPLTVPYSSNNEMVDVVRQALAIDECRCFFRQNLWFGEKDRKSDVLQVWFPGMHSDVGGGYAPKDSRLALVAFTWMLGEALEAGLHVDPARSRDQLRSRSKQGPDPTAPILPVMTRPWRLAEWLPLLVWDRRSGNRAWRWSRGRPRSRPLEPVGQETRVKLHRSVQRRLDECPDYRPCNLPALERCDLVDDSPLLDGYR